MQPSKIPSLPYYPKIVRQHPTGDPPSNNGAKTSRLYFTSVSRISTNGQQNRIYPKIEDTCIKMGKSQHAKIGDRQ
ncbi:unnamed protein product [Rotaria sp. Silwood2]|nr:unnamed protein product [Rotaria sp. Silwood2]CAF3162733.1 unnamed protein product [Rotaria sp. Silwood2]CAF4159387.1 unnamed protein product [Rotaria sp. Silwood2]CAF4209604.1 unnamed protein product [Rotaria sp. Silwood2]